MAQLETARGFYGLAIYLSSWLLLACFFIWVLVPDRVLEAVGITYYPQKQWAIRIPAFLIVAAAYIVVMSMGYSVYSMGAMHSIHSVTDRHSVMPGADLGLGQALPDLCDIPLHEMNQGLYSPITPWRRPA